MIAFSTTFIKIISPSIGAPQQANAKRTPTAIELVGKADTLGRLVHDPGDAPS
jgi:hypothetical protein